MKDIHLTQKVDHEVPPVIDLEHVNLDEVSSPVVRRLVAEVRAENLNPVIAYNRTHNRHNRGR